MAKAILLEGLDGSGKSTQVMLLKQYFEEQGHKVLTLREPGGSDYYEAIRANVHFTEYQRPPVSDALACAAGIAANVAISKNALENNTWVVTDRSFISNIVYQRAQGLQKEIAERITHEALEEFSYELGFLIDIPINVSQKRLSNIGKLQDRWESKGAEYFTQVRSLYHEYASKYNLVIIDGQQTIDSIHRQILSSL